MDKNDRLDKVLNFVNSLQKEIIDDLGEKECVSFYHVVLCPAWDVCKDTTKPCSYWLKKYIEDGE